MARGPSKPWEAREPATPINQKTRKLAKFRKCSHPPSIPPRPEASRTPERVGFLVYWFTMAPGPSKSWEAREPAIPINQKTRKPTQFRECSHPPSLPPRPEASRTPERVGFLVYWFTMAPGPSKSWEAREPAIPINQKTRNPTQFRECSHPPSGSRTVKVLGGQGAGHTNKQQKTENQPNLENVPTFPPSSRGPKPRGLQKGLVFWFIGL